MRKGKWDEVGWMGRMEPQMEVFPCISVFGKAVCPAWPLHALSEQPTGSAPGSLPKSHLQLGTQPHSHGPSPSFLAAPDHPGDEIPELVLNQLFLEITAHFLTQIISFCLRGSSLEFLNATVWIDEVPGQCTAVDSCFPGDFSSPSNQGRQRLSP